VPILRSTTWTRRHVICASLLGPTVAAFGVFQRRSAHAAPTLAPTPACDGSETTPRQTAGPFFKPASPERQSLIETGIDGERIVIEGVVLSTRCEPLANALIDLWHADADGQYDNRGFRLRGHQYTDATGRYSFETIVPGNYGPRTRHYHIKVQAPNQPVLTTQLYFPDEDRNATDFLFRPELLMVLSPGEQSKRGRFDFVLEVG